MTFDEKILKEPLYKICARLHKKIMPKYVMRVKEQTIFRLPTKERFLVTITLERLD